VAGSCEHGNEPWGSMKGGEISDQLRIRLAFQEGLCYRELSVSSLVSSCRGCPGLFATRFLTPTLVSTYTRYDLNINLQVKITRLQIYGRLYFQPISPHTLWLAGRFAFPYVSLPVTHVTCMAIQVYGHIYMLCRFS
jgi:hypothetical protein